MLNWFQPYQIGCSVSISGVDLSTDTTTTDDCVIKDFGGTTQETIDLTSGSGTGAMYYTAGIYTLEGTVVIGGTTYTGSTVKRLLCKKAYCKWAYCEKACCEKA